MRYSLCVATALLFYGCVEDSQTPSKDQLPQDSTLIDAATDGSIGADGAPDSSPIADAGADLGADGTPSPTDAVVDAAPDASPDQMVPVEINDCQTACERVIGCERTDLYEDAASCEAACERAGRSASPDGWFQCIEVEACTLLHLCRLPEPPPLTCAEVCDELSQCEADVPIDCLSACEADANNGAFTQCGELLYGGGCETANFWNCIGEQVYPDCAYRCEVGVQCNVLRAEGCVLECIGQMGAADALRALRARQTNQCVRAAQEDCRRVDACINVDEEPGPIVVDRETFCREWNECFADFIPCELLWEELPNAEQAAACVVQRLRANGCPRDPNEIFQQCFEGQPGPVGPGCNELCEAQAVCEMLDDGVDQFACARDCNEVLRNGDQEAIERISSLFVCGVAESCDALTTCLEENSPVASCAAHCALLDECGLADEECVAQCDDQFFQARATAYRACVRTAEGCAAIEACERPMELECARLCERAADCVIDAAGCIDECDDELFDDLDGTMELAACIMTAPLCTGPAPSFTSCGRDATPGHRCAQYCLGLEQCALDDAGRLTDCLEACGNGYTGDEGIRFAAAGPCLDAVPMGAECAAIEACIPDPVAPNCGGWCDALTGCEVAPADCDAICPDDVLARIRSFEQLACLGDDLECPAVEGCLGDDGPIEPLRTDEAAFCEVWAECGYENFGACEDVLRGMNAAMRVCMIGEIQLCPDVPFDAFEQCERNPEAGAGANPAVLDGCTALCHSLAQCEIDDGGENIRLCAADCYQTMTAGAAEDALRIRGALNCRSALSCDELGTCLSANSPDEACANYCDALGDCGLAADDCAEACDAGFFRQRNESARECVLEAGENCETVAECLPTTALPCDYICERVEGCNLNVRDCAASCDDEHFESPVDAARQFACAAAAPRCSGLAQNAISGCGANGQAGGACWSYCWARTGCDATDGETLGTCLIECGEGFVGDEAIRFAASRDCIEDENVNLEDCAEVADCIPADVGVDCAPWCGGLNGCEEYDECAQRCPEDPLSRLRVVEQEACVQEADADCEAIAVCAASDLPEALPAPNPNDFCAAYRACGFENQIPCNQILPVLNGNPGILECLIEAVDPCPRDAFEILNQCLEGNPDPRPRLDYGAVCARLCQAQAHCGQLQTHARDCTSTCIGALESPDGGVLEDLLDCRDDLSCPELLTCTELRFSDDCDVPCNRYLNCGGAGFADLAECRNTCNQNRLMPQARATYPERVDTCLVTLLGDAEANRAECAAQGLECFAPGRPSGVQTCAELCPALAACEIFAGQDPADCVQGCSEADREDPVGNERIRACLSEVIDGGGCDENRLQQCFADANGGREAEEQPRPGRPDLPPPPPRP